ncbi:AAA family ATPase [Nocardia africana]|uniref:Flp pilus assembly protein, ATPase CpaE n=1 Tax=Nocardia africana TaxID=134964 RepID=A0A378WMF7_9NOCA|nr:MinD/ParA family protein [Nocardia africana]MCC3315280.1 AAA family ATPase [Nocardia africana]SUA42419.1 Flp pilus assembly protein, ATPase CpaE [Nocardia africana]
MNRAPSTNGHAAEAVRARGGYDAFFAAVPDQPGPAPTGAGDSAASMSPASTGVPGNAATTAGSASGAAAPLPSEPVGAMSADAARPAAPPTGAPQSNTAQTNFPPQASVPPGSAQPGSAAPNSAQSGAASAAPTQPGPVAPSSVQPGAAHPGATQSGSVQPGPTQPSSVQPGPAQSAAARPEAHATTTDTAASQAAPPAAETAAAGWHSATQAAPATWQQTATSPHTAAPTPYSATPSSGASAASRVPERVERGVQNSERVEILPAALTSAELLADIAAAHRAQLKSTSGVRGALNKVGFNLGLSPSEQRKQDRRGRIRRQLNSTYQIAVISVKGGVGRTTVTAALGSTFARLRPDRVVAIDANPDFGDLPTRTRPHPYGLTLRDLVRSPNLEAFSAVHSFTSINDADLAVVASPWNTESVEALSGGEYSAAVEILRRHYNLMLVDCGTGVLDSATGSVLNTSDAVLVVTPATVGGVKGAVATLNWLNSHGMQHLIAKSIVAIVHHHPVKPTVEVDQIEKLFATAQRPTFELPYDAHLSEGGEIDLRLLDEDTALAFEELAAALADGFPGSPMAGGERGGWR